jgi:hypothetical protein
MTKLTADKSLQKAARVAGLAYLLIIVTSTPLWAFDTFKFIVEGNDAATFSNIMAKELLFRFTTAYELFMYVGVVILSIALYAILKTVNKDLALFALCCRLIEAIMGCLVVLSSLVVLQLLNGENYSAVFEAEQLHALVGLFLVDVQSAARSILIVFISLGTIVFCYLFFKSKYIPRILAGFGIFSFLLTLIYYIVAILFPNLPAMIQIVCHLPGILFEVIIGLWLLIKGVNVEHWEKRALESA